MFKGKTLTQYANVFSPNNFEKNDDIILSYFKKWMKEWNSIENNSIETIEWNSIDKANLTKQKKFRLSEIIGIENYFYQEINQRKSCSRKLNKYVTAFDYIDRILIVLSATSSGVSIIPFTRIAGAPVGIASASLTLIFLQQQNS